MADQTSLLVRDITANDSDKTFTVPAKTYWNVNSIQVTLVSTATAGNRQITVVIADDQARAFHRIPAGLVQAASLTRYYTFAPGLPLTITAFVDTAAFVPFPAGLKLPPGFTIQVRDVEAIDAAADDMDVLILGTAEVYP